MESIWSRRAKQTPVWLGLVLYGTVLLSRGGAAAEAVAEGLRICGTVLVPGLFPFMVFSNLAAATGLLELLGRGLEKPMAALFRLPGCAGAAWLIGALGGYPLGVQAVRDLYRAGGLDRDQAGRLLGFCACCGPGFLIGTAGGRVFGSSRIGLFLLAIHWAASLLTGFLLTRNITLQQMEYQEDAPLPPLTSAFTGAVRGAVNGCLGVCGFYLFFRGLIALLPAALAQYAGVLEMSCGILGLSGARQQLPAAAAILGWGGLSVHCQAMDLLADSDLDRAFYWKGKLLHSLLSAWFCLIFLRFL